MKFHIKILAIIALMGVLLSCEDEEVTPDTRSDLVEIASMVDDQNIMFRILAEKSFAIGYHSFEIEVTDEDTGEKISGLDLEVTPMMNMTMHSHSAPVEEQNDPVSIDGYYPFAVVFIMAGNWELNIEYSDGGALQGAVSFSLPINAPAEARLKSFEAPSGEMFFISLLSPSEPLVGVNDFELAIHRRENMMSFPAVSNCSVLIEPSMPSMGHGSPNNVDPVHTADGHYMGKVNFTMDGEWLVEASIFEGEEEIGAVSFDITL